VKKLLALFLAMGLIAAYSTVRADDMKDMKMEKSAKPKKVTLTGTLVDVSCYVSDGETGNDHGSMKGCGSDCLKGGSPAGLLVGKKLYIVVFPAGVFADYAGKQVELTGVLYGTDNLIPTKAAVVDKDGKKKEISLKGKAMM
jgi:hypothetical protein